MVIYLNANGTIQYIYPEVVTQGSNSQSIVLLTNGIGQGSAIAVNFVLPNGDKVNGGLMIQQDSFVLNDEYVNAYTFDITKSLTNYSGHLKIAFEVVGGGLTTNSYEVTIPIVKSIAPIIPTQPSDDEWYAQILEAYNYILQQVDVDIPQDIADAISEHNTSATAHADIRQKITDDISSHNTSSTAHADIRQKITDDISAHNTSETAHAYIRGLITALGERVTTNEGDIGDLKTLTSGHTTEINNLKDGTTVIPTYELKANKITSWSGADNTTYPSAKLVKDTIDAISSASAYSFDTLQDFLDWLDGEYTRPDGVIPSQLNIGNEIYIIESGTPDYWVSSKSDPMTISDFSPLETTIDLSDYVQKTTTIAGVDLQDNITKGELKTAIDLENIQDGPTAGIEQTNFANAKGSNSAAFNSGLARGTNSFASTAGIAKAIHGHAEGEFAIADGWASHAEGGETIATHSYQHVEGIANEGKQLTMHEVGNGRFSFVAVSPKPTYSVACNFGADGNTYYFAAIVGGGHHLITEKRYTEEQYNALETVYTMTRDGKNIFEVYQYGSLSNGVHVEDLKLFMLAFLAQTISSGTITMDYAITQGYDYCVTAMTPYLDQLKTYLASLYPAAATLISSVTTVDELMTLLITLIFGQANLTDNYVISPLSFLNGMNNKTYSLATFLTGYGNTVGATDDIVCGTASGALGVNNTVKGQNSLAIGDGNTIQRANNSAAFGNGNIVDSNSNSATIVNAFAIGNFLKNYYSRSLVIGYYNDDTVPAGAEKLFQIGNGTGDNARSNAFEVTDDGIARAFGTPSGNNDLITKGYADSHYSGGGGGGSVSIDDLSITENSSNQIQAVGVIGTNGLLGADTIDTGLTIQIYEEND